MQYAAANARINVSNVYTQFDGSLTDSALHPNDPYSKGTLRIVGVGTVGNESHAFGTSTDSSGQVRGLLSAIEVTTKFLTFPVFDDYTFLCDQIYPKANDTLYPHVNPPSCQYGPGTVAFGVSVPFNTSYEAGTLWTRIRLNDPSTPPLTLACIDVQVSPYNPNAWIWNLVFFVPIALVIVLMGLATFASLATAETSQRMAYRHRAREGGPPTFFKDKLRPMMISTLGGKQAITSPSLLRFVTPGCWDIILHLQFIVAMAMCHVEWPEFAYPFFRQAAWSTLLANVTIVEHAGQSHGLLDTNATLPSDEIGSQMNNVTSPLYMNASQPSSLLNLGRGENGIETYAAAIGIQSSSFFGTCLTIWLAIIAVILVASGFAWIIDACFESYYRHKRRKEVESGEIVQESLTRPEKASDSSSMPLTRATNSSIRTRSWRGHFGSHGRALHGNIIRALVLFHLPITIFSTFQIAQAGTFSTVSVALAALALAFLSVIAPIYIILRLSRIPQQKLFEDTHTLLALGPVYHRFNPGSQLFYCVIFIHSLVLGIVVGAGQGSGSAQLIIIMVVEVVVALVWSLWLPWGDGSMMGPLTFLSGIIRITTSVLVFLLTPLIGFGHDARGWLTYVILLLQGILFTVIILVVATKVIEALVRLIWRVRFDERVSGRTAGLSGAIRKIRRRKLKKRKAVKSGLQLRSIRPASHSRTTSFASASTMNMLEKYQSPYHARQQNADKRTSRPLSGSDFDYYGETRPSSRPSSVLLPTLGRINDKDEYGTIMAAMPPMTSPAFGKDSPSPGLIRTGGERPIGGEFSTQPQNSSRQHAGAEPTDTRNGRNFGGERSRSGGYQVVQGRPSQELSSTQTAAQSARQSMIDYQTSTQTPMNKTRPGFTERLLRAWGRTSRRVEDSDDEDEDDTWSDDGTARWDNYSATKGGWQGLRTVLFGKRADAGEVVEPLNQVRTSPKGFEVVRPARGPPRPSADEFRQRPIEQNDHLPEANNYPPHDDVSVLERHGSTAGMSAIDFYRGPLGMLGADMQHAPSSAGHTDVDNEEERFWLPPIDVQTESERQNASQNVQH